MSSQKNQWILLARTMEIIEAEEQIKKKIEEKWTEPKETVGHRQVD